MGEIWPKKKSAGRRSIIAVYVLHVLGHLRNVGGVGRGRVEAGAEGENDRLEPGPVRTWLLKLSAQPGRQQQTTIEIVLRLSEG